MKSLKYLTAILFLIHAYGENLAAEENCQIPTGSCTDPITLNSYNSGLYCSPVGILIEVTGNLDQAFDNDSNMFCGLPDNPTVWYALPIDGNAANLQLSVDAIGFDATWGVYDSCSGNILPGGTISDPILCGEETLNGGIHSVGVDSTQTSIVYIAISATDQGKDGSYTLSYATSQMCVACSGETEIDCYDNGQYLLTVDSDQDGIFETVIENNGSGRICPGVDVEICFNLTYDTAATGDDWIHGLVPIFGNGWDLLATDLASQTIPQFVWYDETDETCFPRTTEQLPNLCTYEGLDGELKICNTKCQVCPCETGPELPVNKPIPSGWFANTEACGDGECPHQEYGLSGGTQYTFDFCIIAKTKEFDTFKECIENRDLSISFQTFSDGVTGCWNDPISECLVDPAALSPYYELDCESPPSVEGGPIHVCSGSVADLVVSQADGGTFGTIVLIPIENPNITGATMHTFDGGFGTIDDVLTNLTCDPGSPQTQVYIAEVINESLLCPGPITEIEVIVHPKFIVEFDLLDPEPICFGDDNSFEPFIEGGFDDTIELTYSWTVDGGAEISNDHAFDIDNLGDGYAPGVYNVCVTVTDDLGCMDNDCLNMDIRPELLVEIVGENELCLDCPETIPQSVADVILTWVYNGDPNDNVVFGNFDWEINPDENDGELGNDASIVPGELWIFDCYDFPFNSNTIETTVGEFEIILDGTDQFGCEFNTEEFIFTTSDKPEITATLVECNDNGATYFIETLPSSSTIVNIFNANDPTVSIQTLYKPGNSLPLVEGTYIIESNFTNSDCLAQIELIVARAIPAVLNEPTVCIGEDGIAEVINCSEYSMIQWTATDTGCSYTIPGSELQLDSTFVITLTSVNGCEGFQNVTMTVNDAPEPEITGSLSFCTGSNTVLGLSETYSTYNWSNGDTNPNTSISSGGTITVTVSDTNGCIGASSVDIQEDSNLDILGGTVTICDDGLSTATFDAGDANPNYTFAWDSNAAKNGTIANGLLITSIAGSYMVTVTEAFSSCTGEGVFTLSLDTPPTIDPFPSVGACDDPAGGVTTVDLTEYEGASSPGSWSDPNAVFDTFDETNLDFEGHANGIYEFIYTTVDVGACQGISQSLIIEVVDCGPTFDCPLLESNIGDPCDDGNLDTMNDIVQSDCTCLGEYDCTVLELNIGDPCDDGNPETMNDIVGSDCTCQGEYDCPAIELNIGDSCDDGNPETSNDVILADCTCLGAYDCPELMMNFGEPCNDNNILTENDVIQSDCMCMGDMIDCTIDYTFEEPICNPADSPYDPSDDIYFVDIQLFGIGAESWFTDIGESGVGVTSTTFGPFMISDGDLEFRLSSNLDPDSCWVDVVIQAPSPCAIDCNLAIDLENDEVDVSFNETFSFDISINDNIPSNASINQLSLIDESVLTDTYIDSLGLLTGYVSQSFIDPILIDYQVCFSECDTCAIATVSIVNQDIKDYVFTNMITPNGDSNNDVLKFSDESEILNSELYIFNRWGVKIYEAENYTNDWDANGYPGGIYYYVLELNGLTIKKTLTIVK